MALSVQGEDNFEPDDWSLGLGMRATKTPFKTSKENISDVLPLISYRAGNFEIDGLETRLSIFQTLNSPWSFGLLGKYRFVDIPVEYATDFQGGSFDFGFEANHHFEKNSIVRLQLLSDRQWKKYLNIIGLTNWRYRSLNLKPYSFVQIKSSQFNQKYFELREPSQRESFGLGLGYTLGAGLELRYPLIRNLYLVTDFKVSLLDEKTRKSGVIESSILTEGFVGFALGKDQNKPRRKLRSKRYLRVSHAWATPSDLKEIFSGHIKTDRYHNQLTSFSYGVPIGENLFGLNTSVYFAPMFVQHYASEVQQPFHEYVIAIKAYLNFDHSVRWKLGFGEGLSYVERISYIEGSEMIKKGFKGNRLLNYLDFSADFNLGDLTGVKNLDSLWLGLTNHHRSGIFRSSSLFGRINGGSNYNGLNLLYDF